MFLFLSNFFQKKSIDCWAPLPLSACRIQKPYLLERAGIADGTAILIVVPYFTSACRDPQRNLSAYAVSKNYHAFFDELYGELLPILKARFPKNRFACFADHSPIAEVEAAARAGLGVIGDNHLLLTEKYSSYIFLGELITDAILPSMVHGVKGCEHCGACSAACPMKECGTCLSALTQKKGTLDAQEQAWIVKYGSVWGCDLCQESCPHTVRAQKEGTIFTPIPYFWENTLPHLTGAHLDAMSEEEFLSRAYSWRGRETIERNLAILKDYKKGEPTC
ncbi:MAG: epoxyqueuosine reductase [Clostridia bacterium]|nr:epoxyqueuosine reductase [Clostridia bacterium]